MGCGIKLSNMEINHTGELSYRIRGKSVTVLVDMNPLKLTVSQKDAEPFIINGPGEYEIKGVNILGIATPDKNVIYEIRMDGLVLIWCGNLMSKLSDSQAALFDSVDLLFVQNIDEIIAQFGPKIVIPIGGTLPAETTLSDKLVITKDKLPETTQIVALK